MNEFLRQNYFLITHVVEFLAAAVGLYCLKKFKGKSAVFFIWFLLYSAVIDLCSRYPRFYREMGIFDQIENTIFQNNYWYISFFWVIISTIFYIFYFQKIIKNRRIKAILKYSNLAFILFSIITLIIYYEKLYSGYIPALHIISTIAIISVISLYFYEMLNSERILTFYKSINFYISSTILVWWLITTPMVFYEIYFSAADWNFVFLKWQIFLFANIFMYLTFTFALIFCKPKYD